MGYRQTVTIVSVACLVSGLIPGTAPAQFGAFGAVNLPDNDFTWQWGDFERGKRREDISIRGGEGGFLCDLKASYALGNRLTREEQRAIEQELQTTLYFVQQTAYTMNVLDRQLQLGWATLQCAKPVSDETEEERQERVDRLRERALEKSKRRRARRDDN